MNISIAYLIAGVPALFALAFMVGYFVRRHFAESKIVTAEAMARMSWGSIAWAGAGAASVAIPTTTSTTATSWNQVAWRSMPRVYARPIFIPPRKSPATRAARARRPRSD